MANEEQFALSKALSIGIELELQIVKPQGCDLTRGAADLLARLERHKLSGAIKPEITESMIELNSSVHTDCEALLTELEKMRSVLIQEADLLNLRICGGGSHPFHEWADRRIFRNERFDSVVKRYAYLAKQFTVFGQHIHIGCSSGDHAITLAHKMTRYVPHFIALSASSPFSQGEDTSFHSSRLTAVSAFPLAGHIPFTADWAEFVEYFRKMKRFGIVGSMKDFYWDIRPKPEYGTIEIRVCDTPLTLRRAMLLAGYAQALAAHLLEERTKPSRDVYLVNSFNRFEASRFGFSGSMVDVSTGTTSTIAEDILTTLRTIAPQAKALRLIGILEEIGAVVKRGQTDADWLRSHSRDSAEDSRSLPDVVRAACDAWSH
jgi:glutamate---cysteine ligase / carboxylate-amine ligase